MDGYTKTASDILEWNYFYDELDVNPWLQWLKPYIIGYKGAAIVGGIDCQATPYFIADGDYCRFNWFTAIQVVLVGSASLFFTILAWTLVFGFLIFKDVGEDTGFYASLQTFITDTNKELGWNLQMPGKY